MNDTEKDLIMALTLGKISADQFFHRYPVAIGQPQEYLLELLTTAHHRQNADDVEHALLLGYALEFSSKHVEILGRLIVEQWHRQHENIASLLQKLQAPESVESLYQAAITDLDYLDYDESYALAVKCAWALGDINTEAAKEKLRLLTKSDNPVKSAAARNQLERHHGQTDATQTSV